ncbi:hypothetical protein Tco_0233165 [Tanacetum coccineum]
MNGCGCFPRMDRPIGGSADGLSITGSADGLLGSGRGPCEIGFYYGSLLTDYKSIEILRENEIGDGGKTDGWYDKWNDIGPFDKFIPFKKRYEARFSEHMNVVDLIDNGN